MREDWFCEIDNPMAQNKFQYIIKQSLYAGKKIIKSY
jgi:hypothetical protein